MRGKDSSIDVLIPTYQRKTSLAITLTGLATQILPPRKVIISDQTEEEDYLFSPEIESVARALELHGSSVVRLKHLPRRGMAEQRSYLLSQSDARYVLFLDDDLLLESYVISQLLNVIEKEKCGFVGSAPIGLSYLKDERPHEQAIEIWNGPVNPERISWETIPWERHRLHNAANPYHVQRQLQLSDSVSRNGSAPFSTVRYKVAWIGACIMYDRKKLLDVGGYSWWPELPAEHCGEDVLVQLLLLRRYGGCGILPSGVYHLELPTQVKDRTNTTNGLIKRFLK